MVWTAGSLQKQNLLLRSSSHTTRHLLTLGCVAIKKLKSSYQTQSLCNSRINFLSYARAIPVIKSHTLFLRVSTHNAPKFSMSPSAVVLDDAVS